MADATTTPASAAGLAAALAASLGLSPEQVSVSVSDLIVSSTLSLGGLSDLSVAAAAALQASLSASLQAGGAPAAANLALGSPSAPARRLLDLSLPVTVDGLGVDAGVAAAAMTSLVEPGTLSAAAFAAGATSAATTAPLLTTRVRVSVVTHTASDAASADAVLSDPSSLAAALQAGAGNASISIDAPLTVASAAAAAQPAAAAPLGAPTPSLGHTTLYAGAGAAGGVMCFAAIWWCIHSARRVKDMVHPSSPKGKSHTAFDFSWSRTPDPPPPAEEPNVAEPSEVRRILADCESPTKQRRREDDVTLPRRERLLALAATLENS